MISDTLFEAATSIEDYLTNPVYLHWYGDEGDPLYDRIRAVQAELRAITLVLDTPPDDNPIVISGETATLNPKLLDFPPKDAQ